MLRPTVPRYAEFWRTAGLAAHLHSSCVSPPKAIVLREEGSLVRLSKSLVVISLIGGALTVRSAAQTVAPPVRYVAGDVLVKFKPGVSANARADAHRVLGATPLVEIPRTGVHRVRVPAGDESAAIARYRRNPNVLYAEPNFIRRISAPSAQAAGSEVVPGDYHFHEQWALHNTGQAFYCIPWISRRAVPIQRHARRRYRRARKRGRSPRAAATSRWP